MCDTFLKVQKLTLNDGGTTFTAMHLSQFIYYKRKNRAYLIFPLSSLQGVKVPKFALMV